MNSHNDSAVATEKFNQLINFALGDEDYGVDIQTVKEVIRKNEITRLPKAPAFVKGVINLRGNVIPILDLRERFGMEQQEYTEKTRVIVVEIDSRSIGMVVDGVSHVIRIKEGQIVPPPPCVGKVSEEFIRGIGKVDDKLIVLLKIDRILSTEEKVELDKLDRSQTGQEAVLEDSF